LLPAALIVAIGFAISRVIDTGAPPPEALDNGSRLSEPLGGEQIEGYPVAGEARAFQFPQDHGPHRRFRNEWWYLTGNLDSGRGQRFGYELTFFRFSLSPEPRAISGGQTGSNWQTNQVYVAHFAVTDEKREQFHVEQRFSRGALGLAGAQTSPFMVWIGDWSIQENQGDATETEDWQLSASGDGLTLELSLVAEKPPVLNGVAGLSRKSESRGHASWYYSISRMRSAGTLQVAGVTHEVSGLSWLDREWGSSALAPDQRGWDWFALQLTDGSDLMFYNIRKSDGSQDQYSGGSWISADGERRHLGRDEVVITVTDEWQSPAGGAYPSRWDIQLPALGLALTVTPVIANQELITTVRYWEGAVDVTGRRNEQPIEGRGYVELTGYDQ
jgi:predicted secreted hydrolase